MGVGSGVEKIWRCVVGESEAKDFWEIAWVSVRFASNERGDLLVDCGFASTFLKREDLLVVRGFLVALLFSVAVANRIS